ncbi:MAG: phosphatase PAP2 family protein [Opitutae bacterium]
MADYSTQPTSFKRLIAPALFLAGVIVFFGFPFASGEKVDFWFQSFFWNGKNWLIPHDHFLGKILAYDGPKALIILFAVYLLVIILLPKFAPRWLNRRQAIYVFVSMAVVSVTSTQLRAITNMATPLELTNYGGAFPHLLLFQSKPAGYPCHGFPAGHASGGLALISLYWAWFNQPYRKLGLWIGLGLGGLMGLYQIARGEHMLSHTLATLGIAWLLSALLAIAIKPTQTSA